MNQYTSPQLPQKRPELQEIGVVVSGLGQSSHSPLSPPGGHRKRNILIPSIIIAVVIVGIIAALLYYNANLEPVKPSSTEQTRISITPGSSPDSIAKKLKENELIRDVTVFLIYIKLNNLEGKLQAGDYSLSKGESVEKIVRHLQNGKSDETTITFLPGGTLKQHKRVLERAGYSSEEIDAAFTAKYEGPLFEGRSASDSLEGYVYGETYRIASGASVKEILQKTFDQFYDELNTQGLLTALPEKGYSLREAIIFASIVQREERNEGNQRKVAGVFTNRLAIDMPLQSDPTYIYAADLLGEPAVNTVDSPYNTYKNPGLPPGPIASPSISAILAIVNPAPSDFLYFLSGDDNQLYFAKTLEEHEQNIKNHCKTKCYSY